MDEKTMTDIVTKLRQYAENDMRVEEVCLTAADEIERLLQVVYQYRDDLHYPPSADSVQRRLKMIDDILEGK